MTSKSFNQAFLAAFSKGEKVPESSVDSSTTKRVSTRPASSSTAASAPVSASPVSARTVTSPTAGKPPTTRAESSSTEPRPASPTECPHDPLSQRAARGEILRVDHGVSLPQAEGPREVHVVENLGGIRHENATRDADHGNVTVADSSANELSREEPHRIPAPHFPTAPQTPPEEIETRATWIVSDLQHHARLLETTPLLVIPSGADEDLAWPPSEEHPPELPAPEVPEAEVPAPEVPEAELRDDAARDVEAAEPAEVAEQPQVVVGKHDEPHDEFISAWEVDHLGWTSVCQQLYDAETEPFSLAGQQLFTATAEGLRVLAITSAYRGEGRTTMALLLARSAAAAGVRVAVLDADLDNPHLALNARVQPASDWRRSLTEQSPLEEAAIHAVDEQITLFPLETQSRGEPLRLSDPRVTKLIHDIAARFDLLIIDMGPIANDDRRLFAGGKVCPLDAAVVVRDLRYTTDDQTQGVVRRLMDLGVEAVGIAENFVRDAYVSRTDDSRKTVPLPADSMPTDVASADTTWSSRSA